MITPAIVLRRRAVDEAGRLPAASAGFAERRILEEPVVGEAVQEGKKIRALRSDSSSCTSSRSHQRNHEPGVLCVFVTARRGVVIVAPSSQREAQPWI